MTTSENCLTGEPINSCYGYNPEFYANCRRVVKEKIIERKTRKRRDDLLKIEEMREKNRLDILAMQAAPLPPEGHPATPESLIDEEWRPPKVEEIKLRVMLLSGYSNEEMECHSHEKAYVVPRHLAIYLSRKYTARSLNEIGRRFGNRDHSTVKYSHDRWQERKARVRAERTENPAKEWLKAMRERRAKKLEAAQCQ